MLLEVLLIGTALVFGFGLSSVYILVLRLFIIESTREIANTNRQIDILAVIHVN